MRGSLIRSRIKQNLVLSRNHRTKLYGCVYNPAFQAESWQISFRRAKTVAVFDFLSRQFLMSQAVRCSAFFLLAFLVAQHACALVSFSHRGSSLSDFVLIGGRPGMAPLRQLKTVYDFKKKGPAT